MNKLVDWLRTRGHYDGRIVTGRRARGIDAIITTSSVIGDADYHAVWGSISSNSQNAIAQ